MKPARRSSRRRGRPTIAQERAALRAVVDGTDVVGTDEHGNAWLLLRASPELLDLLAVIDAADEDLEDGGDGEESDQPPEMFRTYAPEPSTREAPPMLEIDGRWRRTPRAQKLPPLLVAGPSGR